MWYGKLSIITFLFCILTLFSTYYLNQVFQDPYISSSTTYTSVSALLVQFGTPQTPNAQLVFGDFISAFNLLSQLFAGGIVSSVFGDSSHAGLLSGTGFGGIDASLTLLVSLLFDSSTLFLLLYIISFRSI